jgi:hypothetical protein
VAVAGVESEQLPIAKAAAVTVSDDETTIVPPGMTNLLAVVGIVWSVV